MTPFLLSTETRISVVSFGTYLIAADAAETAVRTVIVNSFCHIDMAEVYGNEAAIVAGIHAGLTETGLARADIFVTVKL